MTWIISSRRLARRVGSTPALRHSWRWSSLKAPPTPTARTVRPSATRSTVATAWASSTGCRRAARSTAVPSRTRRVRAASAASAVTGSGLGFAVRLSPSHMESRPACSAVSAIDSVSAMFVGRWPPMTRLRVGRRMPILGFSFCMSVPSRRGGVDASYAAVSAPRGSTWLPGSERYRSTHARSRFRLLPLAAAGQTSGTLSPTLSF